MPYRRVHSFVVVATLCALVMPAAFAAQKPSADKPAESAAERQAKVRRAIQMVDASLAVARTLKVPENRLQLQLLGAGLLWEHDPERGRTALRDASQGLMAAVNDLDPSDYEDNARLQALAALRSFAVYEIAARDAGTALDLLRGTRTLAERLYGPAHMQSESTLELSLATKLAESDPRRAYEIGKSTLASGMIEAMPGLIQSLYAKDPVLGAKLAGEFVDRLSRDPLLGSQTTGYLLVTLLAFAIETGKAPVEEGAERPPVLSAEHCARLIDKLIDELGSADLGQQNSVTLVSAIPYSTFFSGYPDFARTYAPDRAEEFGNVLASLQTALGASGYGSDSQAGTSTEPSPTAESLLEKADSAPSEAREYVYHEAVNQALQSGDSERARQIASTRLHGITRTSILDNINRNDAYQAMAKDDFASAFEAISNMRSQGERISMLVQLAMHVGEKDPKLADQLIGEAETLLGPRAKDQNAFYTRLSLVQALIQSNPSRAFGILESCIDQLNGILDAVAAMEGFACDRTFVNGEVWLRGDGGIGSLVEQSIENLAILAGQDFDRARIASSRFARPEAEAYAAMRVARSVLGAKPSE